MKFLDFFAGIGGFRRGMELAGHECVGFCEYDKFAYGSYVSMHLLTEEQRERLMVMPRNKRIKEIGKEEYRNGEWYARDVREIRADHVPRADCWCFGFPCQDISVAGKQLGFRGERSSLFFAVMRIIQDTKEEDRPTYLFIENVKNLLSVNGGTDFLKLLIALDEAGYDAEWQVLNSADFGVPQSRERVFIVGHHRGKCGSKVFPVYGTDRKNHVEQVRDKPPCFVDMSYGSGGEETDKAFCLQARYDKGICGRKREMTGVMVEARINSSQDGKIFGLEGYSQCLSDGNNNQPKIICPVLTKQIIGFINYGDSPEFTKGSINGNCPTLRATNDRKGIIIKMNNVCYIDTIWYEKYGCYIAIRKLTPKECFRLQGWEDIYFERAEMVNSDSQLYKQAGNGVTVNVIEAIAKKMEMEQNG